MANDNRQLEPAALQPNIAQIGQAMLEEAQEQSASLRKQADDYKAQQFSQAEHEVLVELYGKIQGEIAQIKGSSVREIARQENAMRQELLLHREELTGKVFDAVSKRLLAFAATSQYRDFLLETASSLCGLFPQEGSVLLVAPRDLPFADDLAKAFGKGCRVEASDAIRLGGLQCQNQEAGLFADETLDSKLEDQRAWFAAASGLTVE